MDFNRQITSLEEGTVVLTSTERVARFLRMQLAAAEAGSGKKAWFSKAVIKTVTSWIEQTWLDLMPDEQLLFPVQELAVTKAVTDSSGLLPETMISSTSTARKANQAFALAKKYGITLDRELFLFKSEYEAFFQWQEMIEARCKERGWVYRAHLPELLLEAIQRGEVTLPKRVLIVGLLQVNPAEQAILDAMESMGCVVEHADHAFEPAVPALVRAHSQDDEYAAVANWVAETLATYADEPLAAPTMAILVPDVRKYGPPLMDALGLIACPTAFLPTADHQEVKTLWDISSGASLGSRPVVRCALDLLSITPNEADIEVFSRVLRSRWIYAPDAEAADRAVMDVWLRENLGLSMGGTDFLRALGACQKASVPSFRERFGELMARRVSDDSKLPSAWAEEFAESLTLMGWPGMGDLDSANFQTMKAWDEVLVLYRTLDAQLGKITYQRAYMWLREVVDTRQFQPRISHVAPVSIMSYEEAIGLHWEKVWVLGASNAVLPVPASPTPFIPTPLQIAAGIPEASGELALERGRLVVDAVLRVGDEIVVSCPMVGDKGVTVGHCDLFGCWPEAGDKVEGRGALIESLAGTLDRSVVVPEVVPPVSDEEKTMLKGGVGIFKDYAEAPFYSFAKHRLGVTEFPLPVVGLDPRIQGTMVHLILELFWTDVRTSEALKAMTEDELFEKVVQVIELASERLLNKLIWRYGKRIIRLEQNRLTTLTIDWLELEKTREYEFEVLGFEEKHEIVVGEVPVTVKIDRRDRVFFDKDKTKFADVVLDYKTGSVIRFKGLNAQSLTEPQLPIYATQIDFKAVAGIEISGVALAQVNSAALGFHVRSDFASQLCPSKGQKSGVDNPVAWAQQTEAWDTALQEMAAGFMAGNAVIESGKHPMGYEFIAPLTR